MFHYAGILWAGIHRDYRACANFLPKGCSSYVSKIFKTYFLSYQGDVKTVVQPSSSRNISCDHCHNLLQPSPIVTANYFLHRITRKLGSTATSTAITGLLPLTDYISGAENEQLRALSGHANGNIKMRSPSAAAMITMVAAAIIVRFPPLIRRNYIPWCGSLKGCLNLCISLTWPLACAFHMCCTHTSEIIDMHMDVCDKQFAET